MTDDLFAAAVEWRDLGYSVLPVSPDKTKRPAIQWKRYQTELADDETLVVWFADTDTPYGLGVVTGAVSQHLECFEFEGRAVREGYVEAMRAAMETAGQSELWAKVGGYVEWTPSGGLHLYYRVDGTSRGNTKLARRPSTPEELAEHPMARLQVLIETRGEGGYVVVAPTPGKFHQAGVGWSVFRGSPATIPLLTEEERDTLHAIATTLDRVPVAAAPEYTEPVSNGEAGVLVGAGVRPGDDFNAKASWNEILVGWRRMRPLGTGYGWQRPGKNDRSISATTGTSADGADRLYVFSSSTDFETETPYSKFAAYTHLHHSDDYTAAAKTLKKAGFGENTPPPVITAARTRVGPAVPEAAPPAVTSNGSLFHSAPVESPEVPEVAPPSTSLFDVPPPVEGGASDATSEDNAENPYPRYTDKGNAAALVEAYGEHLRYDCDRSRWLVFKGHQWEMQPPGGGDARELMAAAAVMMPFPADDKAGKAWLARSLSSAGITAALISAETVPGIAIHTSDLDTNPRLLGTPGGTVNLWDGDLRPGRPMELISRSTTVTPDFGPVPQIWTDFLNTTFQGDESLIRYVQNVLGLALIGEVREQVLPLFYGPLGHNGKSTIIDVAQSILGISERGYATSVPSEILMVRKHEAHSTELAQMAGRRLIVASELEDGQRLAESRIKLITGNDVISARFLYGQPFSFVPTHLIIMVGNNRPRTTTGGPALWRRLKNVPFAHQVPEEDRDPQLPKKLLNVGGHILAWMIRGAQDYYRRDGLPECAAVDEATAEYQSEEDSVGQFVEERVHLGGPAKISVKAFRTAYEEWCEEVGDTPVSAKRIGQEMLARFDVTAAKGTGGVRCYVGVTLLADEESPDDAPPTRNWYDK